MDDVPQVVHLPVAQHHVGKIEVVNEPDRRPPVGIKAVALQEAPVRCAQAASWHRPKRRHRKSLRRDERPILQDGPADRVALHSVQKLAQRSGSGRLADHPH
eukprot:scaffold23320_cov129-Isochrysis_galbana.AAC.2